ncbi:hypothetical protein B484DRAFT_393351 [Ochromonadaceae sp. CCMP2298]|nr:hypothetical protein B484DRAFT_393351 [Ochromonadaceae sp. CCMP2298]
MSSFFCCAKMKADASMPSCTKSHPVYPSAISSTAVELYCFDINTMAHVQCHTHASTMNMLTEILTLHDPPVEKVAYYFRAKYNW